jgi:nucleoside-diphosphate-sugar epimerase
MNKSNICVLVTGGTGFLGRAFCCTALKKGIRVIEIKRRNDDASSRSQSVIVPDFNMNIDWSLLFGNVSCVVHTAARVHVMADQSSDPLSEYRYVNVNGTLNLARGAAQFGVKRFIFISSIKVNGEETERGAAFTASGDPMPIDPYGVSKCEAEIGLREISKESGMEVVIIRPPLIYGPNVKANFASLIRLMSLSLPLPLGQIHDNRRSFVALDNLIDLILTCISHPAAANETFLVSDGEDVSTTDLLRRIAKAMGKSPRLIPIPPPILRAGATLLGKQDMAQRLLGSLQVDIEKTRRLLNWSPPITVDEGLRRTVAGI